jgi:hypothetical protein
VIQTRLAQQQNDALRTAQRKLDVDLETLRTARAQAAAAGEAGAVQQLDQAISRAQQLRREQSEAIRQEFDIKLKAELQQDAFQTFQRAEETLRDFRVAQIEDVIRKEQEATDRRVSFLERLGESAAGRELVRSQGLRGTGGDERDFGVVAAAILRQFEQQGERTIDALNARLEQLRVSGSNTFQELRDLKEREKDLNTEISSLIQTGADPQRLAEARSELQRIPEELKQLTDRGVDNARELNEVSNALGEARTIREENLQRRRELALNRVEQAASRVNNAEKALTNARNQVPQSNQAIIQSQRNLAQAESRVEDATRSLSSANQQLADANFQLALNVGLAEFRARQAAGGFSSVQQAIGSLQGVFENAVRESRGSFEAILNARREVLQEEVSLVQNQLQALRGLSQRAFTADPEQLSQLQEATQIAAGVQAGQIGAQQLVQLPPELRQALSGLTSAFPALQQAIDQVGAGLLGIDPNTFQNLEQQLVQLQTGIAETGQTQVEKAEEAVRTAQEQLEESRVQKDLAQQQLESTVKTEVGINKIEARQGELVAGIEKTGQSAGEQLGILKATQPSIDETRVATKDTAANVAENVRATVSVENTVAEVGGATIRILSDIGGFLQSLGNRISSGNIAATASNATGSLSSSEINGLLRAARLEKRAMPPGSKLMLANTSETVLTRRQARGFGLSPRAQTHAQGGNAVVDGGAFEAVATELGNLNNQLQDISTRASQPQQVNVSVESSRNIQVEGINNLQSSLQDIVTQRLGNTPSQAEVDAISQTVVDVVDRLKEQGNNF